MWWATAIQVGLSLFGFGKQKQAGKDAEEVGRLNAAAEAAEGAETIRRMERQGRQQEGFARTAAGASGFSIQKGTSQFNYIKELVAENQRQRTFTAEASKRKQDILVRGGQAAGSIADAAALGSLGTAVGALGNMWSQGKDTGWGWT